MFCFTISALKNFNLKFQLETEKQYIAYVFDTLSKGFDNPINTIRNNNQMTFIEEDFDKLDKFQKESWKFNENSYKYYTAIQQSQNARRYLRKIQISMIKTYQSAPTLRKQRAKSVCFSDLEKPRFCKYSRDQEAQFAEPAFPIPELESEESDIPIPQLKKPRILIETKLSIRYTDSETATIVRNLFQIIPGIVKVTQNDELSIDVVVFGSKNIALFFKNRARQTFQSKVQIVDEMEVLKTKTRELLQ